MREKGTIQYIMHNEFFWTNGQTGSIEKLSTDIACFWLINVFSVFNKFINMKYYTLQAHIKEY